MANSTRSKKEWILGAAVALVIAAVMIPYPVFATVTPPGSVSGTQNGVSPAARLALPSPPPTGEQIILTSTSGHFVNVTGTHVSGGPASGTMTLTVTGATMGAFYVLTVTSGSVTLDSANAKSTNIPFTGGMAVMNPGQWFIVGSGTVTGGTFHFQAFDLAPSIGQLHPLNFNVVLLDIHVGGNEYKVVLQVTTTVIPSHA